MKKPKFKDLTFKSHKDFNEWLYQTAKKQIVLQYLGQDISTIWVHESGEILHCDFHSSIYNGKFINMENLNENDPVEIDGDKFFGLIVEQIKDLKNETATTNN